MKIGLFTDTYLPHMNGVATHVKTLKEGLERLGHDVTVVTADPAASDYYVEAGILHCPAVEIKRFYGNGLALPESTGYWLDLNGFHFDVIHVHTEFGIGISGVKKAKRERVPLIYTMHTMWEQYLHYIAPKSVLPIAKRAERAYVKYFAGKADEIIGPSARVQGFLEECGINRRINVIPNAVELDLFSRGQADNSIVQAMKKSYGIADGDIVMCFSGRLGKEKDVDVLIDFFAYAHRQKARIKLMIIGEGPMSAQLQCQARDLGIIEDVIFTGRIAHESMREAYACCDLFATASRSEVNSISMLEAMAMGLPVLHIMDVQNPEQVKEGVNGYIYRNREEFKSLLNRFCDNPEERKRLRASTADSVHGAGQEALAKRVEQVYSFLL